MGEITVELDAEKAPITTENFLKYVDDKFFDGLIFHRVMPRFMIQGGGFDQQLNHKEKGLRAPIRNESGNGLTNTKGTIAMARTPDPNSATSQFFINHATTPRWTRAPAMPSSARSSAGWTWSTRSPPRGRSGAAPRTASRWTNLPAEPVVIKSIRRKDKS